MTTIAFVKDTLYADTLWDNATVPAIYKPGQSKIAYGPGNLFAYGISGAPPTQERLEANYFPKIIDLIKTFKRVGCLDRGTVEEFLKIVGNSYADCLKYTQIVVTREFGFAVSSITSKRGDILQPLVPGDVAAVGAGWDYFLGAYHATQCVKRAYAATAALDHLTNNTVGAIPMSALASLDGLK